MPHEKIRAFLDAEREAQAAFLAELVKVPSDNPPGDCRRARRARGRAARGPGLRGRAPPGARGSGARQRHDQRHQPRRPPPLRRRGAGDRAQRAWRRRAARRGLDQGPFRRRDRRRLDVRPRRRGLQVRLRHLRLGAQGARGVRRRARRRGGAPFHLRRGGRRQYRPGLSAAGGHQPSRISPSAPASPTASSPPTMAACISRSRSTASRPMPPCPTPASTRWRPRTMSSPPSTPGARRLTQRVSEIPGIGSPQLTVGLIKGGINTNVVPDRVTFRLDRRMIPEERAAEVEAELRAVIAEAAKAFPKAKVEVRQILVVEPLTPLPGGERMTELLCRHAQRRHGRAGPAQGRAALHRCPALRIARHPDRALRRRARTRSRRPTRTVPTSGCRLPTCARPPRSWRSPCWTCCRRRAVDRARRHRCPKRHTRQEGTSDDHHPQGSRPRDLRQCPARHDRARPGTAGAAQGRVTDDGPIGQLQHNGRHPPRRQRSPATRRPAHAAPLVGRPQ